MMTLSELWRHFKLLTDPQDLSEADRSFLQRFLSEEQKLREEKRIEHLLRQSGIKRIKLLKEFDWTFNPKIPRDKIMEFLNTQWLKKPSNLVIIGPCESRGTLLKIIKINYLFVFEIVVSRGHATASQIRQPWDPSPCDDPRDRGAQYIFRR